MLFQSDTISGPRSDESPHFVVDLGAQFVSETLVSPDPNYAPPMGAISTVTTQDFLRKKDRGGGSQARSSFFAHESSNDQTRH
jgi:hypothetical protein